MKPLTSAQIEALRVQLPGFRVEVTDQSCILRDDTSGEVFLLQAFPSVGFSGQQVGTLNRIDAPDLDDVVAWVRRSCVPVEPLDPSLKLYAVMASIPFSVPVLAQSPEEACRIAHQHWSYERSNISRPEFRAEEVTMQTLGKQCDPFRLPWGPEGKTFEGGSATPQRTFAEYLAERRGW